MKQKYSILFFLLGLLMFSYPSIGQSFSHKDNTTVSRTRKSSLYKSKLKFANLFNYPDDYSTKAHIADSSNVTISFSSTNSSTVDFYSYYYSTSSGQYFYYQIPAEGYGEDTLTVSLTYNDTTATSYIFASIAPISCDDDSYTMEPGDTNILDVVSNDDPSDYLDESTLEIITDAKNGITSITSDYTIQYIASNTNYSFDTIVYRLSDTDGNYDTATATIEIHENSYASKVYEFMPGCGQFTNTSYAADTSTGENIIGNTSSMVSLGGYGGYIVAGFDQPIINRESNAYGVDFTVVGNAYSTWSEPAAVQVMKDENGNGLPDDTWYELAGSEYYFSTTLKDLTMTYYNPKCNGRHTIPFSTDKDFNGVMITNSWHTQSYYPDTYSFNSNNDSLSFTGTYTPIMLNKSSSYKSTKRAFGFGYADNKIKNSSPTDPTNPYYTDDNGTTADGFDLEWAVDADGNHVDLDTVNFVKVYSTTQADGGGYGELSTEVVKIAITTPDPSYESEDYYLHRIGWCQDQVLNGTTFQFEGLLFKNGIPQDGTEHWSLSDNSEASIDDNGLLTTSGTGETTVRFYINDSAEQDSFEIEIVDLISIAFDLSNNDEVGTDTIYLVSGKTDYLSMEAFSDSSESSQFYYETYNWTSSSEEVGTIDNGLFRALSPGITMITATSTHDNTLKDTVFVLVEEAPEISAISDTVEFTYYDHDGTLACDDLFEAGDDATVYMEDISYSSYILSLEISNNELTYTIVDGMYDYVPVDFVVNAFDKTDTITIVFNIKEPENAESPKQVLFVNGGEYGSLSTELLSYIPDEDTTITVDNYIGGATSVQDMIVDGNYAYISADYYITRYNISRGVVTDSIHTQDLNSDEADGTGTDGAGLNNKMATYQNLLLATRQNSSSAPEDGYNVRVYNKTDLSLITKIPVSDQATDIVVVDDTAYVMINGGYNGTSSTMAIIDLTTLTLNREVDLGTDGLGVSQMIVKDDKIYCMRLAGYVVSYNPSVVVYDISSGTTTVKEYTAGISYDSSPLAIEPNTNDTIYVKKGYGFAAFNTSTNEFGDNILMSIPSYYTQDADHIARGSAYDEETGNYYIAYGYWSGDGVGQIYNSSYDSIGSFDGVGASPEALKISDATDNNEKPYAYSLSSKSYDEGEDFKFRLSSSAFKDYEDTRATTYMYNPLQYDWLSYDVSTRYMSGNYDGEVLEDTTFNVLVQGIDDQGASVIDTVKITISPVDDPMVMGEPIADIEVLEDAADSVIDLTKTFVDVDDSISAIILSNSNEDLVDLTISGENLIISFNENQSGEATVIVQGDTNDTYYTDTFNITVTAVADAPVLYEPFSTISGDENDDSFTLNLDSYFKSPDGDVSISYEITNISFDTVADASISEGTLSIDFKNPGQTYVYVTATSNDLSTTEKIVVGVTPEIETAYSITTFEDLSLDAESYWNGSDESGVFTSGLASFANNYNSLYYSWTGWAYANVTDNTTAGYNNQYSAMPGGGYDSTVSNGKNFGIGYISTDYTTYTTVPQAINFTDSSAYSVNGLFVTNTTYAALSMRDGDSYAKQFGGEDRTDDDYFMLSIWGMKDGSETDTVDFYLADYRYSDTLKDYIVETWQYVDLSSFGKVDSLMFDLSSSDVGSWGINTPTYFALDNMDVVPDTAPAVISPIADITDTIDSPDTVISLAGVFSDVDDDNDLISYLLISNSDESVAGALLSSNKLTISFVNTGSAELIIGALSNGKLAYDTLTVNVVADNSGSDDDTDTDNNSEVDEQETIEFTIYPNPSEGSFKITGDFESGKADISILNIYGQVVYQNNSYTENTIIDLDFIVGGKYIVVIKTGNYTVTKSIVLI